MGSTAHRTVRRRVGGRFRHVTGAAAAVALVTVGWGQTASATWSIVGVDPESGEVGVAVASCVGFEVTVVPVLVPGVGAAASQADISAASGDRFVDAIAAGEDAAAVLSSVVGADDAPDDRQFGVVVLDDGGDGWTGAATLDVAVDQRNADGTAAAQGNVLASPDVVSEALQAFDETPGPLADRLVAALVAGADAGGDQRCAAQTATAAALLVASPQDATYAETDAGLFGVDPAEVVIPSVFVSVLVNAGDERAPDRLADLWADADRAGPIVVRQVDDGADTAASRATAIVVVGGGVIATVALVLGGGLIAARRRGSRR